VKKEFFVKSTLSGDIA